jgi:hypothetical protein
MQKRDSEDTNNRVSLGLRCGECIHFQAGPRKFEKLCVELGQEAFSHACPEFTPAMNKLAAAPLMDMRALADITAKLNQPQLRLLAYTFRNMDFIRKAGLTFGQTVVFSIDGKDYLENYFSGIVVGASKDGQTVYVTSDLESLNKANCMLTLSINSIKTLEKYAKHRDVLIKKKRVRAPVPNTYSERRTILQLLKMTKGEYALYLETITHVPKEYQPPSLDAVPADWLDSRQLDAVERKKSRKPERDNAATPNDRKAGDPYVVSRYSSSK